jgi:hypothetical protein
MVKSKDDALRSAEMLKKCFPFVMVVVVAVSLLLSCGNVTVTGSGNITTQSRSVSGYTGISFAGAGELNITQGTTESLAITTDDNLMEYIETTVKDGVLYIKFREGVDLKPSDTITFDAAVISLNSVVFTGAGSLQAIGLQVPSGGFDFSVSGVADCVISGQTDRQDIVVSGTCTYEAPDFESASATVTISGVGNVTLWALDTLDVTISGVGNVYYYGTPGTLTSIDITGVGEVQKLGNK